MQQRKRADVRFLSGVFSRCECVSGIIDGSNGNIFDSTGSEQSLAEAKRTCGDILRFPGVEDQYYWLITIRAARAYQILRRRQQESVTGE